MVSSALTAMQAIAAATRSAAQALGMEDRLGSIQAGKQADLLVVDGDPAADISALSRVRLVMFAGRTIIQKIEGSGVKERT